MAPSNPPRKILMVVTVGGYTHAGETLLPKPLQPTNFV